MANRRGYLLIEVMLGIAVFAVFAGAVSQVFLLGLNLYHNTLEDPNESTISVALINRIKRGNLSSGSQIDLPLNYYQTGSAAAVAPITSSVRNQDNWHLKVEDSPQLLTLGAAVPAGAIRSTGLYAIKVKIWKGSAPADEANAKKYEIFRYISA